MKSAEIDLLVQLLSSLQGIGPRSANRIILQLIQKKEKLMIPLATILNELSKKFMNVIIAVIMTHQVYAIYV